MVNASNGLYRFGFFDFDYSQLVLRPEQTAVSLPIAACGRTGPLAQESRTHRLPWRAPTMPMGHWTLVNFEGSVNFCMAQVR